MSTIKELRAKIEREMAELDRRISSDKREVRIILDTAERNGQTNLSQADDARAEALIASATKAEAARARKADTLAQLRSLEAEQDTQEDRLNHITLTDAGWRMRSNAPAYDEVAASPRRRVRIPVIRTSAGTERYSLPTWLRHSVGAPRLTSG